ncbi:seminal metalloprotease 1-like [Arctopsyche grandis]|uniref:seminal metalloprotease 1-like n=1 Tax=Arctopsyche grandis TaxID=121162 RepID=UPI00406D9FAF
MKVFAVLVITLSSVINKLSTIPIQRIKKDIDNATLVINNDPSSPLYDVEFDLKEDDLFEGDIILNSKQRKALNQMFSNQRNAMTIPSRLWPNATVHYRIIETHFNPSHISAIQKALNDIQNVSCVKFINHIPPEEKNYITITGNIKGCFSNVGMEGGEQIVNVYPSPMGRKCFRAGSLIHELLHALGFFHMQSTVDRDDYVKIVWENILPDRVHNFAKYTARETSSLGVEYDYESVLHYSNHAFSKNRNKTMIPLKPRKLKMRMGQRKKMTDKDILKLNRLYHCKDKIQPSNIQNTVDDLTVKLQDEFKTINMKFQILNSVSKNTVFVR